MYFRIIFFIYKNTIVKEFASAKRKLFKRESTIKWKKVANLNTASTWSILSTLCLLLVRIFFFSCYLLYSGNIVYEIMFLCKIFVDLKGKQQRNYVKCAVKYSFTKTILITKICMTVIDKIQKKWCDL